MKIYSWNVNGIRAVENKGKLAEFITREDPDIICFQEIKAHETQLDLEYPQYNKFWNSAEKKGYSGTAIWSKNDPLNVYYGFPEELIDDYRLESDQYGDVTGEGRVLTAEYDEFYLITVYTPNSKNDLSRLELRDKRWDPAFLAYVTRRSEKKPVIFCGDLNVAHAEIDLANPKPNVGKHGFTTEERRGFDNMLKNGFIDTYRAANPDKEGAYTWWTHWANARARNVGWRIDYFLASESIADKIKNPAIHPDVTGSDHCPVSIEI
ncbi:MAG: exodeoxyribonuclease III [Candidatus Saccharimonadales bacterium]